MTDKRKAAPVKEAANQNALREHANGTTGQPVKDNKITRVLALLVAGRSINRLEVLAHGDTVLNSTISTLRNSHGLTIADEWETHTGPNGSAPVKRYWIPEGEAMEQAHKLLNHWRAKAARKAVKGG
ncbi:hypothetical protein [Thiopseudomonas denitrificans]|uniref:Helix-turn-helix protein n=1 Tax=Thiopseudomonas denitrificans TaxID=1501432 RepID=A0A4R6TWE3_9GAMM|nr:hypothetical protein [Thiopseudomonas denitrificans]TDQ37566.1 helix-turn-helix protein [Thiopseudomonas denitrificans]